MVLTKESIVELLKTNDKAIGRALVVLNERQTADEQTNQSTRVDNGQGFTPADAYMGTSMAIFYARFNRLSEKQLAYWKKPNKNGVPRICKYANQLLQIALQKQAPRSSECIGNLMEEKMVLEERIDQFKVEIELYRDSDDLRGLSLMEIHLASMYDQLHSLNERAEEVRRCEFKMAV